MICVTGSNYYPTGILPGVDTGSGGQTRTVGLVRAGRKYTLLCSSGFQIPNSENIVEQRLQVLSSINKVHF